MTKFQNQNPVEIQIFLNCRLIFQKVKSFVSLKTLFLCNLIVFIHLHVEAVQLHMLLKHKGISLRSGKPVTGTLTT